MGESTTKFTTIYSGKSRAVTDVILRLPDLEYEECVCTRAFLSLVGPSLVILISKHILGVLVIILTSIVLDTLAVNYPWQLGNNSLESTKKLSPNTHSASSASLHEWTSFRFAPLLPLPHGNAICGRQRARCRNRLHHIASGERFLHGHSSGNL